MKRCEYCGDPFDRNSYNQKFCSALCSKLARARISIADVCANCSHPRAAHFASRGACSLFVAGDPCGCSHFRFKRDDVL